MERRMARFVIDYFELPVQSAGISGAFFSAAFGCGTRPYGDDYAEIIEGGVLGGLNSNPDGRTPGPVVGIRTDDIVEAEAAILRAGGTISKPVETYPGGRRFLFREPGGNELLVYQPEE